MAERIWWIARPSRTGLFHLAKSPTDVVARCGQLILGAKRTRWVPAPLCVPCARVAGINPAALPPAAPAPRPRDDWQRRRLVARKRRVA